MDKRLFILGNSAATPTQERDQTSQLLHVGGQKLLIDCGEGTQSRLIRLKLNYQKIDHIFISHLHGDHYLGVFGLLNTMNLQQRSRPLTLVAPEGLKELLEKSLALSSSELKFPLHHVTLSEATETIDAGIFQVTPFPVKHRIPCYGFRFAVLKERSLNVAKCEKLNIPVAWYKRIKNGEDYVTSTGETISAEQLLFPPESPWVFVYITDTLYSEDWLEFARDADVLYHEATYLNSFIDRAHQTFHSTSGEAATFALKARVKRLIIGHFSSRYENLQPFLEETRAVFRNTDLALQFDRIDLK